GHPRAGRSGGDPRARAAGRASRRSAGRRARPARPSRGFAQHPPDWRRRVHRRSARAGGRRRQHERTDDPAAGGRGGRRRPARGLPALPDQGGQHLPPPGPPGRRRRPARQRHGARRSDIPSHVPRPAQERAPGRRRHRARRLRTHPGVRSPMRILLALLAICTLARPVPGASSDATVALNFQDVDLPVLARFVSEVTGRNFILDDRVRGTVTIISPTRITPEEAYLVFQSVLQVKGFTTVPSGNFVKIVPVREGRESAIPTDGRAGDELVTRILPLRYADAAAVVPVVQPLVSKDGILTAYPPTNRLVVVDSSPNVERLAGLLRDLDVPHSERATD